MVPWRERAAALFPSGMAGGWASQQVHGWVMGVLLLKRGGGLPCPRPCCPSASVPCAPGPLSEKQEALMTRSPASNARRPEDRSLGPMWPLTQRLLRDFYGPFNAQLAQVLADEAFAWRKT